MPTPFKISHLRLWPLRALYLLTGTGLALSFWPLIVAPAERVANAGSVVRAMLGAMAVLAFVGVRYPLRLLPILLFELIWKLIWVTAFGLPLYLQGQADAYATETLVACLAGVVLVPLAMPWGYVWQHYLRAAGDPWRSPLKPCEAPDTRIPEAGRR